MIDATRNATLMVNALEEFLGRHRLTVYPGDVPVAFRPAFRGMRAARLVRAYAEQDGSTGVDDPEPAEQYIRDLLSDLMHLVALTDFDFDDLLRRARNTYDGEASEPG